MSKVKVFLWNDRLKNYQYVNVYKRSWIISIAKTVWVKVLTKKKVVFMTNMIVIIDQLCSHAYGQIIAQIYIMEML